MICSIHNCGKRVHARGWCKEHYVRWWRHGDPRAGRLRGVPPEQRFWLHVEVGAADECWEWQGARVRNGYGQLFDRRDEEGRKIWIPAHRLAHEMLVGPIPVGFNVLHRCDNPPCCNPRHLFVGSQSTNMLDCVAKGRHNSQIQVAA